jgi:dipeptidyl aminopeptidase/acylaminoacyl peptidase
MVGGKKNPFRVNPRVEREVETQDIFERKPERLEASYDGDIAWCPVLLTVGPEFWFAFVSSGDGGNQDIYLGNTSGKEFLRLTKQLGIDNHPCWSPTGESLVYVSSRRLSGGQEAPSDLYVIQDIKGIIARFRQKHPNVGDSLIIEDVARDEEYLQLTYNPGIDDYPDWSPDGRYIAYNAMEKIADDTGPGQVSAMGLAVLDLGSIDDHCTPKKISVQKSRARNWEVRPRWSPDGKYLACYSYEVADQSQDSRSWMTASINIKRTVSSDSGIAIVNLGVAARNVYIGSLSTRPSWGPDGETLVYVEDMDVLNPDIKRRGRFPVSFVNLRHRRPTRLWSSPDISAYYVNFLHARQTRWNCEIVCVTYMGEYELLKIPVNKRMFRSEAEIPRPTNFTISCGK